jgi:predicted  nucleic acid-binding Zn-ribbon protein
MGQSWSEEVRQRAALIDTRLASAEKEMAVQRKKRTDVVELQAAAKRRIVEARQEFETLGQTILEVEAGIAQVERQIENWHGAREQVVAELQQIAELEQTLNRHREQEQRFSALLDRNSDPDLRLALQIAVKKTREDIEDVQRRLAQPPASTAAQDPSASPTGRATE